MPVTSSPSARDVCVLIVDIARSTALYEEVGNQRARETVGACLKALAEVVHNFHGRVVKSMGDGLLCAFESAENAVQAGLVLRDRAKAHRLEVRIGMERGEVLEDEGGDIFGDAVNTASRVADVAESDEILITSYVRDALAPDLKLRVHSVQPVMVKGKREPLELFSILLDNETGTIVAFKPIMPTRPLLLYLRYGKAAWKVGGEQTALNIGRDAASDVVLAQKFASRRHASVEQRGGNYVLADRSANGTYLVPKDGAKIVLRREEALLHGRGRIYFGADPDDEPTEPVEFAIAP